MNDARSFRIGILGLGNLMRSDDAAGMLVLEQFRQDRRLARETRLIEGGTLGLDLLDSLRGITHLLAIDAVDAGTPPGTLLRFADEALADLPISKSVHLLGFADLLGVMRLLGESPQQVVLLGVQPASTDWGTSLTPPVEAARTGLIDAALAQVACWLEQQAGDSAHLTAECAS